MYCVTLTSLHTPYYFGSREKELHQGVRVLRVEYFVLGLSAVRHNLFVGTSELPKFRMVAEL